MLEIWTEKYRPQTIQDYVWQDDTQKEKVLEWIEIGSIPHLLLSGRAGTGKTSLALLLLNQLGIPKADILVLNASKDRQVDILQSKIVSFVSTWSMGPSGIKYVLLEEADYLSHLSQGFLRAEIEKYADTTRFILTCNYINKISPPIKSRCQEFRFQSLNETDFAARCGEILVAENIEFDIDVLMSYVNRSYPDLRKCINLLQQNCLDGNLKDTVDMDDASKDWLVDAIAMFKNNRIVEGRKIIINQASPDEYEEVYRFFYNNLDIWGESIEQQDEALLIIRRGLVNHSMVADTEINLAATLVELTRNM